MLDFKAKMHQISFWLHGAPPQTLTGGAYSFSAPPNPYLNLRGRIQGVGGMPRLLAAWQLKFNMHEIWSFD